jgi:hypothetical protein
MEVAFAGHEDAFAFRDLAYGFDFAAKLSHGFGYEVRSGAVPFGQ